MLRLKNDVPPLQFLNYTKEDKSMYPRKLRMFCLIMALLLVFMPIGKAMAQSGSVVAAGSVALPITGTVVNTTSGATIGQFNGSFTINAFTRDSISNLISANGVIGGVVTDPAGKVLTSGLQSIVLPVVLSTLNSVELRTPLSTGPRVIPAAFTTAGRPRAAPMQAGCGVLQMTIGGAAAVNAMGFSVNINPAIVNISSSASGPVGGLVCQITGILGGIMDPTSLLNSLLGSLTGLLRGTTGGLLGGLGL